MTFSFMMKKDHFKQKLLLWPQVPFKKSFPMMCYHGNITALTDFLNFREIAKKQDVSQGLGVPSQNENFKNDFFS